MSGPSQKVVPAVVASSLNVRLNRRKFLRSAAVVGAAGWSAHCSMPAAATSTTAPATSAATKAAASSAAPTAAATARRRLRRRARRAPPPQSVASNASSAAPAGTVTIPLISNPTPNPIVLPGGLSSILLDKNLFGQLVRPDANGGTPVAGSRHQVGHLGGR